MARIAEFISALNEEIEAVKSGKGGSTVPVTNGRFLRRQANYFLYSFTLENSLTVIEDTPAEIQVGTGRHPGQIIQAQGLEIVIGVEQDLGPEISAARLLLNSYYLHELLRKKFEAVQTGELSTNFALADQVFQGISQPRPCSALPPLELGRLPNDSQKQAIDHSQAFSLTFVWGPPGTGKTSTLGRIVEAYVKRGMRVLVAVHANAAVDEVTEDIAETLKTTTFYQQGQILRLGNPQKESLAADFPMTLIDSVTARLGTELRREQADLLLSQQRAEHQMQELTAAGKSVVERLNLKRREGQLVTACNAGRDTLLRLRNHLAQSHTLAAASEERLRATENSSALKRLFLGTSVEHARQSRDRAIFERDALWEQMREVERRLEETEQQKKEAQAALFAACRASAESLRSLGVTESEWHAREGQIKAEIAALKKRSEAVQKKLDTLPERILSEARVVCTTLTKTFAARELPDDPFDVLIVDEASMAPMPSLYWALGRCRKHAIIAGDFLQLPPICIAKTPMAGKWLGRSIYQQAGVETVEKARLNPAVCLLDTQYRMHPDIAGVVNDLFYGGLLHSHDSTSERKPGGVLGQLPLTVLDTSEAAPWCSRLSGGSRFNLYHAMLAAHAAQKLVRNMEVSVGIVSPYAAQARLITKILRDLGLEQTVRAATVHRFQGGEEDIIIFDTVESVGVRVAPMLDDTQEGSDAATLLNVALSRAKSQVFLLAHLDYLHHQLSPESSLARILTHFREGGERIDSQSLVDTYFTRTLGEWAGRTASPGAAEPPRGSLYTERNFYSAFIADLRAAREEVILLSPFLSTKRSATLADLLRTLAAQGVKVRLFTKPANEQTGNMALHAETVIQQMRAVNVEVIERPKMHQKAAIIDRAVAWEGSLNILSHRDTGEQMRRLPYASAVSEIIRVLDLDESVPTGGRRAAGAEPVRALECCPRCDGEMLVRVSEFGAFLSCADPVCGGKKNIAPRTQVMVQAVCKACSSPMLVKSGGTGPFLGCSRYPECRQTMPLR